MTWLSRTHLRPTRRIFSCIRGYASGTSDNPEWFTNIRSELLNRPAILRNAYLEAHIERRLANTLAPFLPQNNAQLPFKKDPLPLGHHLVWFNVDLPPDQLLPDGTDALHSPGGEWVRRMWAGGSVQVRPSYHHPTAGVRLGKPLECLERITDVQLRGDKDSEKIFVTIDRAFADQTELRKLVPEWRFDKPAKGQNEELFASVIEGVAQQPIMTERRILVFLKDKTAEELEAIKAGDLAPTRYLKGMRTWQWPRYNANARSSTGNA